MSAREHGGEWAVQCDRQCYCEHCLPPSTPQSCHRRVTAPTLILATSHATRAGWVTRSVTVDIDGVSGQRVEHYCPTHKGADQ